MITCKDCKTILHDEIKHPVEAKDYQPCPNCGSEKRIFDDFPIFSTKAPELHIQAVHESNGKQLGYTETITDGRSNSADAQENGSIDIKLIGSSPQGESSTIKVCEILQRKLNSVDSNWKYPIEGSEEPVDGTLVDELDPKKTLDIQATKAITSEEIWRNLNKEKNFDKNFNPDEAVNELVNAINKKARDAKIPQSLRKNLVLALDATMLAGITFDPVRDLFRKDRIEWALSLGFKAIWLVGPTIELTHRLDA